MRVTKILLPVTLCLLVALTACGSFQKPITPLGLSLLHKDYSVGKVDSMNIGIPEYTYEYNDIIVNSVIIVKVYPKAIDKNNFNFFALAYQDNKLLYWGYPDEFNKMDDPLISLIGDRFCNSLKKDIED